MVDFNKRWSNKQADIACTEKAWFYSDIVIARRNIKIDIPMLLAKDIEVVIIVSLPVEQISGYDESVYVFAAKIGNDIFKSIVPFRCLIFRF